MYSSDVFYCLVREWVDSGDYKTWETVIEIGWFKYWHAIFLGKTNGFPLSTLHCFLWRKEHFLHFLLSEIKLMKCTSQIFFVCVYFQGKIEILQKINFIFKNQRNRLIWPADQGLLTLVLPHEQSRLMVKFTFSLFPIP